MTHKIGYSFDKDNHGNTYTFIHIDDVFSQATADCKICGVRVVSHVIEAVPSSLDGHFCIDKHRILKRIICATANRFF
ncbi:unnamed protein product [marine sediment metagenome]|uniref:Uncharacterized protein n=1 Tax=marine sediment metagenome TaxID=412755 RepID=X0WWZ4_9ZZZZ